jgi:hypothetical protein
MPSILSQKQDMAAYYGTKAVYAFMATGDPGTGTTVANEAAGGSPPYVRLPIPWGAPDSSATIRAVVTFDLPPGLYTYSGFASAVSGATRIFSEPLSTPFNPTGQSVYTLTCTYQYTGD